MANSLGQLIVRLGLDANEFTSGLTKSEYQAQKFAKTVQTEMATVTKSIKGAFALVGLDIGMSALVGAFTTIKSAATDEQRSLNQLTTALQTTGHAAGLTAEQLEKMAGSIQGRTIFDDDEIRKAETALLRFRTITGETFGEVLKLGPDVATVMGVDLPQAMALMGRAIIDPARGLRVFKEAGVSLREEQIALAQRLRDTGDNAGAAKIALEAMTASMGGASEADNKGAYGATKRLERAWGDLIKAMGRPLVQDSGTVDKLTEILNRAERVLSRKRASTGVEAFGQIGEILGLREERFDFPKVPSAADAAADAGLKTALERQAAQGKAASDYTAARNAQVVEDQRRLKAQDSSAAAFYGSQLAAQKSYLEAENAQAEFAYQHGELSLEEFYALQKKLAGEQFRVTSNAIGQISEATQALKEGPLTTTEEYIGLVEKQRNLEQQMNTERTQYHAKYGAITIAERNALEQLGDEYAALAEQIAAASGNSAAAAAIGFEKSTRGFRRQLSARGDTEGLGQLGNQGKQLVLQGQLTDEARAYANIVDDLGIKQGKLDLLISTGSISEIDALLKKSELAKQYIDVLSAEADAYQKVAESLDAGPARDAALLNVKKFRLEIDALKISADGLKYKLEGVFTDNLTTALDDVVTGTKSAKSAFSDMAKSITRDLAHMADQNIAKYLGNALFGGVATGSSGGLGGLLGAFFGSGGGNTVTDATVGISGLADGTDNWRGGATWVGERGPELINLPRGAQVIPNHELMARRDMKRATSTTYNVNVAAGATRQSTDQVIDQLTRRQIQASRNR